MNGDVFWTVPRMVSALVVAGYALIAYTLSGGEDALRLMIFCALPLMCIWFPEYMGLDYRGRGLTWPRRVTATSPPVTVFALGWVVLALPAVVMLLRCLYKPRIW